MGISRQQRDTDLIGAHRRHVDLTAWAPVHFDEIGPWRKPVMPPKSKAQELPARPIQSGSVTNARILSVGAYQPSARRKLRTIIQASAPKQPDAELRCTAGEDLVQSCPPQRQSRSELERCLHRGATVQEANTAKRQRVVIGRANSKSMQYRDTGRQDSFAAGFVDGGTRGVSDRDVESFETGCNRRSQSGWSTTNHQDIGPQRRHLDELIQNRGSLFASIDPPVGIQGNSST